MNRFKIALLTGAALTCVASPVLAQEQPRQEAAPAPQSAPQSAPAEEPASEVGEVVVRAQSDGIRTSIDSTSYSLANDLQATTGSLADALRNVPSVDVDPDGNVSLRGDSNVTILVDGRPSGVLSGDNRGQALQQMSADQYARIEVMTNPSAAYTPEGSGGVINLITKPNAPRPGTQTTGSVRFNIGEDGRWNAGVSGSHQQGRLTLSGDLAYRTDVMSVEVPSQREWLDDNGAVTGSMTLDQGSDTFQQGGIVRGNLAFAMDDKTTFNAEVRGHLFENENDNLGLYELRDGDGRLTSRYQLDAFGVVEIANAGLTAGVVRRLGEDGHEWSNELRVDVQDVVNTYSLETLTFVPTAGSMREALDFDFDNTTIGFTSAYVRPMANDHKLRAGYALSHTDNTIGVDFLRGTTAQDMVPVPEMGSDFEGRQTVHALYATYERPFGEKLSAQAGLRLEYADISIKDLTGGVESSQDYFRAYPTGHIQYQLNDEQSLRASYSRRIQRPQLMQLNPLMLYQDPLTRRGGNPDLQPQETDSFEAMWQYRKGTNFYQATAYLRDTDKAFTDVAIELPGEMLLIRPENLGSRRDMGVEMTASGRLHPTLRYNGSVNVYRQEIDAVDLAAVEARDGTVVSGRLSLNWQPTDKDFMQVTGFWQGETLQAQGTREAGGMVNIGYRRKLNDRLSLNVTGRDVFNTFKNTTRYETGDFREVTRQNINLRAFYVGLTWQLGNGQRRQPEQFDFSTAPTGG